jgi:hypothetical protein
VRELLAGLQHFPRDTEVLAFEAGCEDYCEREVDEVEWEAAGCTCISAPDATTRRGSRAPAWARSTQTRTPPSGACEPPSAPWRS